MTPYFQANGGDAGFGGLDAVNSRGFVIGRSRIIYPVNPNDDGRTTVFHIISRAIG